jgi:acetyl esterase/lipase
MLLTSKASLVRGVCACALLASASACTAAYWVGLRFVYRKADLPASRIVRDVTYVDGPDADARKHRLNLFLAEGRDWPTVIFVHGGGWMDGDKDLKVAGADVYGNIGRFLASRGVGAAVISYRLIPHVDWRAQIADVAAAVAWIHRNIVAHGGRPEALFLMGHSAGAQLAARVALDPGPLDGLAVGASPVCGVIAVSGAGYDLANEPEKDRDGKPGYFWTRFGGEPGWRQDASILPFVSAASPPFLLMYASNEDPALKQQSQLLHRALQDTGASSRLVVVPGQSHERMVLALSRDDRTAGPAILDFARNTPCGEVKPRQLRPYSERRRDGQRGHEDDEDASDAQCHG